MNLNIFCSYNPKLIHKNPGKKVVEHYTCMQFSSSTLSLLTCENDRFDNTIGSETLVQDFLFVCFCWVFLLLLFCYQINTNISKINFWLTIHTKCRMSLFIKKILLSSSSHVTSSSQANFTCISCQSACYQWLHCTQVSRPWAKIKTQHGPTASKHAYHCMCVFIQIKEYLYWYWKQCVT